MTLSKQINTYDFNLKYCLGNRIDPKHVLPAQVWDRTHLRERHVWGACVFLNIYK